VLNNKSKL